MSARAWYLCARVAWDDPPRGRPWIEAQCSACGELVWQTTPAMRGARKTGARPICTGCVPADVELPPGLGLLLAELRELGR